MVTWLSVFQTASVYLLFCIILNVYFTEPCCSFILYDATWYSDATVCEVNFEEEKSKHKNKTTKTKQ